MGAGLLRWRCERERARVDRCGRCLFACYLLLAGGGMSRGCTRELERGRPFLCACLGGARPSPSTLEAFAEVE